MHQLSSNFVLGYHGCDRAVAERILAGQEAFQPSENDYDWLGSGIYFWEANPVRGLEFAYELQKRRRGTANEIEEPYVIGAAIDLGFCLDLLSSTGLKAVQTSFFEMSALFEAADRDMPINELGDDLLLRRLDCAVINYLHGMRALVDETPFQTVKGVFTEGRDAYPGAGFKAKTHIQISVCDQKCIKGVFRVPPDQLESFVPPV
ncbi:MULTISPECIES: hypothetical protein [unclassified Afipia]|uniref:hypothetical protein n=1 Tax=unclassified Afipia TaxID=2642050 RepID=UPI0009DF0D3D|nr:MULTISPECIES: hypothetical protein [unclassified Afipia]MAH72259.1 hypothetical protein [Afipia sp.]OUX58857.1 MAG: hypothetical protein CBB64_23910 [Afipia sp. TMED4]HAO41305.1 hypothetical protein [Afipia sp.]HAP13240.1 hypothetical protein [Afipia sp.]HBF56029.1 hypothetical protein [Afipia sp.]